MIAIHRAGQNDVSTAASLFAEYLDFYERSFSLEEVETFLAKRLNDADSIIFLAVDADAVIGIAQVYPTFSSLELAPAWVLNDLFVTPVARGKGVGRALLRRVCDDAQQAECAYVALETSEDNVRAQRLYESEQFEQEKNWHYVRTSTR